MDEIGGKCRTLERNKKCILLLFFVERYEGKRPVRTDRCRSEDSIKMDLKKGGVKLWTGCDWLRTEASNGHL
jgi:hypothetical protein